MTPGASVSAAMRRPDHRRQRWASEESKLARRAEAEALVEGDVALAGRLQVRGQAGGIRAVEDRPHQARPEAAALVLRRHADVGDVDVGLAEVARLHDGEQA